MVPDNGYSEPVLAKMTDYTVLPDCCSSSSCLNDWARGALKEPGPGSLKGPGLFRAGGSALAGHHSRMIFIYIYIYIYIYVWPYIYI